MIKPTVEEVLPLVKELYERNGAGGCLHIVLDDGNLDDHNVEFCIRWAEDQSCPRCVTLGNLLYKMEYSGRSKLYKRYSEYCRGTSR